MGPVAVCVYHGQCFNGSGDCKFIPQAPPDGPPVKINLASVVVIILTYIHPVALPNPKH